jgi:hypothetical protein
MQSNLYPLLKECLNLIKSCSIKKKKVIENLTNIEIDNYHNTIMINDYEATCKIVPYLITTDTPIKTTDTTQTITMTNTTLIFNVVVIILDGLNYEQENTEYEYRITVNMMTDLIVNVHNFVNNIYYYKGLNNPYNDIVLFFDDYLNDTLDEKKYGYLNKFYMPNKLICYVTDDKDEEIINSFRIHFHRYKESVGSRITDTNNNRLASGTPDSNIGGKVEEEDEEEEEEEEELTPTKSTLIKNITESLLINNESEKFKFSDYIVDNTDNGNEEKDIKEKQYNVLVE